MTGPVRLTRAIEFATSLRYRRADLSDAENAARFGPEARKHGHNYRLEVTVRGKPDPVTGMVIDLKDVNDVLEREVMARFDHRDLNDDCDLFADQLPTPENFARVLADLVRAALPPGLFDRLRLHQDAGLFVDVVEPDASRGEQGGP